MEALSNDADTHSMDTSSDPFEDVMSCIEYDIPCQILGDDSEKVLDWSWNHDLQGLPIEEEVESCKEINTMKASGSSEEASIDILSSCTSIAECVRMVAHLR